MADNIFIMQKSVQWSFLTSGMSISTKTHSLFSHLYMNEILEQGAHHDVFIIVEGEKYKARLGNENFNRNKYATHPDIIRIMYGTNSALAKKLRSVFYHSYEYFLGEKEKPENKSKILNLPDTINEYYVLSATNEPYVFEMACFTVNDALHLTPAIPYLNSEDFENSENDQNVSERIAQLTDPNASVEECERIVKVRRVDRSIIENLKFIYDYRCQITGEKIGEQYGKCVIEAHHIEYFSHSQNNDAKNIIIISPNYHRIIHRNNPHFNFETKCFEFDNGERLKLKLNEHL